MMNIEHSNTQWGSLFPTQQSLQNIFKTKPETLRLILKNARFFHVNEFQFLKTPNRLILYKLDLSKGN